MNVGVSEHMYWGGARATAAAEGQKKEEDKRPMKMAVMGAFNFLRGFMVTDAPLLSPIHTDAPLRGQSDRYQTHLPMEEVFLCEEAPNHRDGSEQRRVFSCGACKKEVCQDPTQYDLFDGHVQRVSTRFLLSGSNCECRHVLQLLLPYFPQASLAQFSCLCKALGEVPGEC